MKTKINLSSIIKGTILLTISGILSRILGFLYRIFIANRIGSMQLGIYQLVLPVIGMCMALSSYGVQTILTKQIGCSTATKDKRKCSLYYKSAVILSLSLSLTASTIIYAFAHQISNNIIKEPACELLLRLSAISLPLSCFHCIVNAYCLGLTRAKFPAFMQLFEQIIKLLCVYIAYTYIISTGKKPNVSICAYGLIAGEMFSFIVCAYYMHKEKLPHCKGHISDILSCQRELIKGALPLSSSRVMIGLFQSREATLIPLMLMAYGFSKKDALSTLGNISGICIPFILFPSTIVTSYSSLLVSKISGVSLTNDKKSIARILRLTMDFCIIFGIFCFGIFFSFGSFLAGYIFKEASIPNYIRTLSFLCPILYIDITLSSILNGLGKPGLNFINSLVVLIIRLLIVNFGVPSCGIQCYLIGILIGELTSAVLAAIEISFITSYHFTFGSTIISSFICAFFSFGIAFFINMIIAANTSLTQTFQSVIGCMSASAIYWLLMLTTHKEYFDKRNN